MRTEIYKALCALLSGSEPDAEIYIGEMPQQFTRPSFLIEEIGSRYDPDYTAQSGENTMYLTITCFGTLSGGYRTEDHLELLAMQQKVIGLFQDGRLAAGGRSVRCSASSGGEVEGEAYVELTAVWVSDARVRDESGIPLMMELHHRNV